MKHNDVQLGEVYLYKRSGKLIKVRITSVFIRSFVGVDLSTGRNVYVSSARRLRPDRRDAELR